MNKDAKIPTINELIENRKKKEKEIYNKIVEFKSKFLKQSIKILLKELKHDKK